MWSCILEVPVPDQCGAIFREYHNQINVRLYTGNTSTRLMWSYIQGEPVPDQCGAIYREN
jgi:hypothetical protein